MSCYVIESDKLFLCSKDTQVMEVYEIENLHVAPVRQKYWTLLATLHLGDGQEFEALQIGDEDIIRGHNLKILSQDLMSLGMMVNREGLCFLKIPECNVSDQYKVHYYRMFDQFDWSNYYVKSRLNTNWARNDIVTGHPIFEKSSESLELNRKPSQDIDGSKQKYLRKLMELKRMHSKEIERLMQKHLDDLEEFERRNEAHIVKLYRYNIDNGNFEEFYSNLVDQFQVSCPISKFEYTVSTGNQGKFYSPPVHHLNCIVLIPVGTTTPSDFPTVNACISTLGSQSIDFDHWRLLEVEIMFTIKEPHVAESLRRKRLLYYDGGPYEISKACPAYFDNEDALCMDGCYVYYILGVGFRLGFLSIK